MQVPRISGTSSLVSVLGFATEVASHQRALDGYSTRQLCANTGEALKLEASPIMIEMLGDVRASR